MSVRAILWKEIREQYLRGGRPTTSLAFLLGLDVLVGLVLPLVLGQTVDDRETFLSFVVPLSAIVLSIGCLTLPMSVVIDSIAGERERHTLETLLASPARDRDIVFGKALSILLAVAVQVAVLSMLCLVSWTIVAGASGFIAAILLLAGGMAGGFLLSTFMTGLGIFISERAPTIKQGQQWLAYATLPFLLAPSFGGAGFRALADAQGAAGLVWFALGLFLLVFVVLNAVFWGLALKGFQRGRLLAR